MFIRELTINLKQNNINDIKNLILNLIIKIEFD